MLQPCCRLPPLNCHHLLLRMIATAIFLFSFRPATIAADQAGGTSETTVKTTYTCEGIRHVVVCPEDTVIFILNANYGRISGTVCNNETSTSRNWDLHCMSSAAFDIATQTCNGKRFCQLAVDGSTFAHDPCPDTPKYLAMRHVCPPVAWWIGRSDSTSRVAHEGSPAAEAQQQSTRSSTAETAVTAGGSVPVSGDGGMHSTHSHGFETNVTDNVLGQLNVHESHEQSSSPAATDYTLDAVSTTIAPTEAVASRTSHVSSASCQPEHARGIVWPMTTRGHVATFPCPPPAQGNARRLCGTSGIWQDAADMSNCVSPAFAEVQEQFLRDRPEKVLERVRTASSTSDLFGGDLRASVHILSNLSRPLAEALRNASSAQMSEAAAKDVMHVSSNLFSVSHVEAWHDLSPTVRMDTAAQLLAIVERSVAITAESINSSQTIATDKAACIIRVIQREELGTTGADIVISIDDTSDVRFPAEAVEPLKSDDGLVKIVAILTEGVHTLLQGGTELLADRARKSTADAVSSRILSVTIAGRREPYDFKSLQLRRPFVYVLNHTREEAVGGIWQRNFTCAFWDFDQRSWSGSGCRRIGGNATLSVCECDHLTNFAVLMDVMGTSPKLPEAHEMSLKIITWIGCVISIISLILSWLTFQFLKNLSCDRNTIHKNLVFTLCLAEMLFLVGLSETGLSIPLMCTIVAALLHFLFLAAFGWMCLEGVQLYVMLIEVFETERSRIGYYYAAGYGIPAIIVGVSAGIDYNSYGTDKFCWLRADTGFIWSFVGPVAAVILVNIAMLGIAIHMMCRHASTAASIKAKDQKKSDSASCDPSSHLPECGSDGSGIEDVSARVARTLEECGAWVKASAVLIVLLGLTWIFGFLYVNEETVAMAYVFTILNSLQGLFIFLFHCVCNDKVQKEYRKFVRRATWLPNCMRIQYGGHRGLYNTTSNSSGGSGNNQSRLSSFKKMLISVRRKRASTTSTVQQSGSLPSARGLVASSGTTGAPEFNSFGEDSAFNTDRSSRQRFTTFSKLSATDAYDGMNGDLSYADASVIDSDCVSDYYHYGLDEQKRNNLACHYAVTCQQCGSSAMRSGNADTLTVPCACRPLLDGDMDGSSGCQRAILPCIVQPYDVGLICKQARSQKGLSSRGLLQTESDEEEAQYLTPMSSPASQGVLTTFGRRLPDDSKPGDALASAGRADTSAAYGRCRPTWPVRDTIVVASDRPMRQSKLEPINEVAHL